ncbi:MAG: peptide ABC transporter permease [Anaerolineaceae bacterium]|nr:peptide ABC transporter permease [Anaerolineaceae bacterium]
MMMDNSASVFDTPPEELLPAQSGGEERHETYFQLVWQRFSRSKAAIVGGMMVITLVMLAVFAEFFSPNDFNRNALGDSYIPPSTVRFVDAEGNFHFRPFIYNQVVELDPLTFQSLWTEDTETRYEIQFFVRSWDYKLLGLFETDIHFIGVEGDGQLFLLGTDRFGRDLWGRACLAGRVSLSLSLIAALVAVTIGSAVGVISGYYGGAIDNVIQRFVEVVMSFPELPLWMALAAVIPRTWTSFQVFLVMSFIFPLLRWAVLAREVRSKVLSLRETDFILAAKEQGASDARIILRHLYPNTLSHVIVILSLLIPDIILAEAFLSFLGIGIQEPLTSWGFLMRNAQNLETLGQNTWILSPVGFIVIAVLGLNFLGDGLRDAADPYANL